MELTMAQKEEFYENGYVKIPGVVPGIMVQDALRAINHSLGEGIPKEEIQIFRSRSYCPELQQNETITDLFHKTPARDLVGSVVDLAQIKPVDHVQIALRFPAGERFPKIAAPHLDGMYTPTNGVEKGTIKNFTALVGVFLSDLPETHAGNFTVWPGSHHIFEKYFREHGAEALLNGMPPVEMPEPVQITAKPGDVVIAHYMLAHGVTPNISPNVRYALFFRIIHRAITRSNWQQSMENIWMHWPGMQEVTNAKKR